MSKEDRLRRKITRLERRLEKIEDKLDKYDNSIIFLYYLLERERIKSKAHDYIAELVVHNMELDN